MDNPEIERERRELDALGFTTNPWCRVGDYIEAASPTTGPTRYRVLERTERRHRWREPERRHYEVIGHEEHATEVEHRCVNGTWRPGKATECPERRHHDTPDREERPRRLSIVMYAPATPRRPEPDVIPWDELPAEEREQLRLLEYELPWPEYEVTVPLLPGASDLTAAQRELVEEFELEGDASGLERLAAEGAGGWHVAWREPTGFPPGAPPVPVDELEDIKAGLLDVVGPVDDVRASVGRGRKTPPELDRRMAQVLHDGRRRGTLKALEELYGLPRSTLLRMARRGGLNATLTLKGKRVRACPVPSMATEQRPGVPPTPPARNLSVGHSLWW